MSFPYSVDSILTICVSIMRLLKKSYLVHLWLPNAIAAVEIGVRESEEGRREIGEERTKKLLKPIW